MKRDDLAQFYEAVKREMESRGFQEIPDDEREIRDDKRERLWGDEKSGPHLAMRVERELGGEDILFVGGKLRPDEFYLLEDVIWRWGKEWYESKRKQGESKLKQGESKLEWDASELEWYESKLGWYEPKQKWYESKQEWDKYKQEWDKSKLKRYESKLKAELESFVEQTIGYFENPDGDPPKPTLLPLSSSLDWVRKYLDKLEEKFSPESIDGTLKELKELSDVRNRIFVSMLRDEAAKADEADEAAKAA